MPDQSEHEKLENLVDQPGQAAHSARSLQEAADSNRSLEGYEAMNKKEDEESQDDSPAGPKPGKA